MAIHKAPPVLVHWEVQVKEAIDRNVALQVLEWVPPDVPTTWCSCMVTAAKKKGKPWHVMDLRALNKNALRQTPLGEAPFHQASHMEVYNGSMEQDHHFITFLTP